jgi:hypothetical protein
MPKTVEQVCQEKITQPNLVQGCNLFVVAVAKEFGYDNAVQGDADAIVNAFKSAPFIYIGTNPGMATARATKETLSLAD